MPLSRCDRALKNSVLFSFSLRHVPVAAAVILRRAAAGDDLQLRAAGLAVLGAIRVVQQPHLGNRIEVDHLRLHAAVAGLVADDAVDDHLAPVRRQAPHARHVDAERAAHRVHRGGVTNAGQQSHERGDVPAEHLDLFDLRAGDDAAVLRLGGVDVGAGGRDADRLAEPADVERDGPDRHPLGRAQHHVLALVGPETGHLHTDRIAPASRFVTWKSPRPSLTAARALLVASFTIVTVAPGTTAPCASTTLPEIAPVTV